MGGGVTEMTFATFAVAPASEPAFAAARSIALESRPPANPLYLHGPTASGKTHLLYAIAHELRARRPGIEVLRTSASDFAHRMSDAARQNSIPEFERFVASLDALLLDDFWLLANRPVTTEGVLRIVRQLVARNAPVVVASKGPPDELTREVFARGAVIEVRGRG